MVIVLGELVKIYKMVEKLFCDEVFFDFVVVGWYVLLEKIWDLLEFMFLGVGGEV